MGVPRILHTAGGIHTVARLDGQQAEMLQDGRHRRPVLHRRDRRVHGLLDDHARLIH